MGQVTDTKLYERALAEGVVDPKASLLEAVYYISPQVRQKRVDEMITTGWRKNRRMIYPPEKGRMINQTLRNMCNTKGLLWDKMCQF
jgi:hypothetical protein